MNVSKRVIDLAFAIGGIMLSLAAWHLSSVFPVPHIGQLGAAVFPRMVGLLLGCSAVAIAVQSIRQNSPDQIHFANAVRVGGAFITTLVYTLVLTRLGFLIATPLFLAVLLLLAGANRIVLILSISIGISVVVYVLFKVLLESPLPSGLLPL